MPTFFVIFFPKKIGSQQNPKSSGIVASLSLHDSAQRLSFIASLLPTNLARNFQVLLRALQISARTPENEL